MRLIEAPKPGHIVLHELKNQGLTLCHKLEILRGKAEKQPSCEVAAKYKQCTEDAAEYEEDLGRFLEWALQCGEAKAPRISRDEDLKNLKRVVTDLRGELAGAASSVEEFSALVKALTPQLKESSILYMTVEFELWSEALAGGAHDSVAAALNRVIETVYGGLVERNASFEWKRTNDYAELVAHFPDSMPIKLGLRIPVK